jgi:predicted phosphodiesterase
MNKNDDLKQACLNLKSKGLSRAEIADRLGMTIRQVKTKLATNGDKGKEKMSSREITTVTMDASKIMASSVGNEIGMDDFFGSASAFDYPKKDQSLFRFEESDRIREELSSFIAEKYVGKKAKILYLSDLHIPFTMYKDVESIIAEHSDADILVINGDLLDLFAVSKFPKDKEIALRRELEEGRNFLEFVSKKFKDVIVTEGNHERRLRSYIKNMIPSDMQFLFPDDALKIIASGEVLKKNKLENVHIVGSWWIRLFDTIFAHPDNYTNSNLKTVQNTSEHFSIIKNIWHRSCIIGHTHRAGWVMSGEVKLVETGCLCYDMDYHNGSNFTRTKWTRAYYVAHFNELGLSEFNKSELIII